MIEHRSKQLLEWSYLSIHYIKADPKECDACKRGRALVAFNEGLALGNAMSKYSGLKGKVGCLVVRIHEWA